jgi:hypothetical protein
MRQNYNTAHNTKCKTTQGPLWAPWHLSVLRDRSSGIYMQSFPIHHLIPFGKGYTELTKSSSHKGGGSDVRPGRRRGGSSGGQGLQNLHRRPAQAPVGLHGEGVKEPPARLHRIWGTWPRPSRRLPCVLPVGRSCWRQDGPQKRLRPPSLMMMMLMMTIISEVFKA